MGGLQKISKKVTESYALARIDPFHPGAAGARVPDEYSGHTTTATLKTSLTITGAATMDAIIFPNLKCPILSTTGSISSGTTFTFGDATAVTTATWGWNSGNLAGRMTNYRLVGMGVRITSTSSMTNAQGRVVIATLPLETFLTSKTFTVGGVTASTNSSLTPLATLQGWGIPASGATVNAGYLAECPDACVISMLDLAENDFDIVPNLCSTSAYQLRSSDDRYTGFEMAYQATTGNSGDGTYLHVNGFETIVIAVDGATTTSPVEIEIIYHVEGNPSTTGGISSGVSSILPPSTQRSPVNPRELDRVNVISAIAPVIRKALVGGAATIHPLLGKFADAVF